MWNDILFDLDGTLTDPVEGITGSVRHALTQLCHPVPPQEVLNRFIGPPLNQIFEEVCGFGKEKTEEAIGHFRLHFAKHGIYQNVPYKGMAQLLAKLKTQGRHLHIATTKPLPLAQQVLDMFNMAQYFDILAGSSLEHAGRPKSEVVEEVLQRGKIDPRKAVMVGDRVYDVVGAHNNALPCVGVLFGYGGMDELKNAKADYIASTVKELEEILLSSGAKNPPA